MHWGKAAKRMMKYDVLRLLGIRECCYFTCFKGCFAEVPHQHIEAVHVLVDTASFVLLKTCSFTHVLQTFSLPVASGDAWLPATFATRKGRGRS